MFEDYLEDAFHFAVTGQQSTNEREAKRYLRASLFYAVSAVEAFVNYLADALNVSGLVEPYEYAFLLDRKFAMEKGQFQVLNQPDFHRLEDKLKFMIWRFAPDFDFAKDCLWSNFLEFKRFRDSITHPKHEEDGVSAQEYVEALRKGMRSVVGIMDILLKGVFGKPIRRKLLDFVL